MALSINPVSWWKLDETGGNNAADSVGGVTLTNTSVTYANTAPAIIGNYAVFSGAANFQASTQFAWAQGTTHSISLWVYQTATNVKYMYLNKDLTAATGGWAFDFEANGKIRCQVSSAAADSGFDTTNSVSFSAGTWYHIVLTTTNFGLGTGSKLYINGVDTAITEWSGSAVTPDYTGKNFAIGVRPTAATNQFAGRMDLIGIFDGELTQADVTALYNGGAGFDYPFASAVNSNLLMFMGPR